MVTVNDVIFKKKDRKLKSSTTILLPYFLSKRIIFNLERTEQIQ
jgi:hypothetical protein